MDTLKAEDILTPQELAERLKVSVAWVYEKSRARGRHGGRPLPCLRVGRYVRFCWVDVVAWMRTSRSPFVDQRMVAGIHYETHGGISKKLIGKRDAAVLKAPPRP
jgi:hypothetical protein